jgi:hypothetical protein
LSPLEKVVNWSPFSVQECLTNVNGPFVSGQWFALYRLLLHFTGWAFWSKRIFLLMCLIKHLAVHRMCAWVQYMLHIATLALKSMEGVLDLWGCQFWRKQWPSWVITLHSKIYFNPFFWEQLLKRIFIVLLAVLLDQEQLWYAGSVWKLIITYWNIFSSLKLLPVFLMNLKVFHHMDINRQTSYSYGVWGTYMLRKRNFQLQNLCSLELTSVWNCNGVHGFHGVA